MLTFEDFFKQPPLFESDTHKFWKDTLCGEWQSYLKPLKHYGVLISQNKSNKDVIKRLLVKQNPKTLKIDILAEDSSIEGIAYEIDKIKLLNRFK